MNKDDGVYVDGQGVQVPAAPVPLMATNEDMQKIGVSDTSGFASTKIKSMLSEPGFRSGDAFITEDEINKRMDVGRDPYWNMDTGRTSFADLEFKSSVPQIVKDEVVKFGMGIQNLGDKARVALGGITALATNNKIGAEMRDRAYDTLESATRRMSLENTNAADAETLTAQVTQGASSMLEMIATGLVTGGIAPLAQMGVEAMGDGTYNNMIKYASEHDGSIEGYQGNWLETGIDLANAVVQVGIERYLGVGSNRFLRGTGGHFLKEAVEGFAQESSQDFLTDLSEYLKGNGDAPTNWEQYLVSGVIGGLLQGSLGAATYKYARTQADNEMSDLIFKATKARHPEKDDAELYKESRAQAKAFNDDVEAGVVQNTWDELANRIDANNDRGKIRDNLVSEFTKARVAALGLESAEELDAEDLADIQGAATVAAGEAFRESFIEGVPIEQTLTARLVADGKDLVVRDLTPEESGVREISRLDLQAEEDRLAQQMGIERERLARQRIQEQIAEQQQRLADERAQRKADIEELQAWAEDQVRLGEIIGARRERGQTAISLKEINRWLKQSSRSEQSRAREERKVGQMQERKQEIAKKPLPKEETPKQIKKAEKTIKPKEIPVVSSGDIKVEEGDIRGSLQDVATKKSYIIETPVGGAEFTIDYRLGYIRMVTDLDYFPAYFSLVEYENSGKDFANWAAEKISEIENEQDTDELHRYDVYAEKHKYEDAIKNNPIYEEGKDRIFQQSLKNIATGIVSDTGRGAYNSRYQRIILNKDSDVSTILHELSHMWLNNWFKAYRSENAPESFRKWWRPVERALGIRESDRFLDQDASEKFARSFEKWVLDGGKGAESSLAPVYERLSKRLADIYDDLATRYFDMVADLKPEVQSWFAKNEALADSMIVDVPERNEETGETTTEQVRVQYRDRAEERKNAMADAKLNDDVERAAAQLDRSLQQENLEPSGKMREHDTSRSVRDRLSAKGILDGYKNTYDQESTLEVAEKVRDYVAINPDGAFEVAMGRKNAPDDLPATMVYTAVTNYLDSQGDVARLWELQQSPIVEYRANIARELQRGRDFFRDGNNRPDIPRIIKYMNKAYENRMTETDKEILQKEVLTINELIDKADLNFEDAWNKILSDMECK